MLLQRFKVYNWWTRDGNCLVCQREIYMTVCQATCSHDCAHLTRKLVFICSMTLAWGHSFIAASAISFSEDTHLSLINFNTYYRVIPRSWANMRCQRYYLAQPPLDYNMTHVWIATNFLSRSMLLFAFFSFIISCEFQYFYILIPSVFLQSMATAATRPTYETE